jgi:hypothetical protein
MDRTEALERASLAFRRAVLGLWTFGAIVVAVWR